MKISPMNVLAGLHVWNWVLKQHRTALFYSIDGILDQLGCKKCYGQKKPEYVMPLLCIRLQELPGGDHLTFKIHVDEEAHALVTTPGAGKWYKTNAKQAFQHIQIQVENNAIFEWVPQETMLFNGAWAHSETTVQLKNNASFIGWDMLVIGRQARDERFTEGLFQNRFKLLRNEQLLVADSLNFKGE